MGEIDAGVYSQIDRDEDNAVRRLLIGHVQPGLIATVLRTIRAARILRGDILAGRADGLRFVGERAGGWRDLIIGQRHRSWGVNYPMVDVDFLVAEYDRCIPCAIVEYKHEDAAAFVAESPSYKTIARLGDDAGVPAVVCWYADDFSWFELMPMNTAARTLALPCQRLTEPEWLAFLDTTKRRRR